MIFLLDHGNQTTGDHVTKVDIAETKPTHGKDIRKTHFLVPAVIEIVMFAIRMTSHDTSLCTKKLLLQTSRGSAELAARLTMAIERTWLQCWRQNVGSFIFSRFLPIQ